MPFIDLVHPDDREMAAVRQRQRLQEEELPDTYPVRIRNKADEVLWIQLSSARIDWDGKPATLNFASDITPQKSLESQLFMAQKMEAVGRLAGGIAHDFNNLLTGIIGYCDLSLMQANVTDALRRNIGEIRKASERCAALTRQLLAFSRKQVLVPKVINLNVAVADMDKILRQLIGEDIDLVARLRKDLGNVKTDPAQIEQVILNLAINARDAMPRGGKLTVETENVELDDSYVSRHESVLPGPYVMLAVSDTGCGMEEKTLAHIFEPFFTTKEKGTGLGLSTVYGIVKQHGGNIWVYSVPGAGTTFKVYLPRVEEKTTEAPETAERLPEELRGSETVLLVEDEELVRQMTREMLTRQGYEVLEASGSDDAVELCSRFRRTIHLMLTDVVMPGMSGVELSKRLASSQPSMKVLFMSGYTSNAIVHQGILDPGVAFLQKPFTIATLSRTIRLVLGPG
jgi:signal transduction histidine kinase